MCLIQCSASVNSKPLQIVSRSREHDEGSASFEGLPVTRNRSGGSADNHPQGPRRILARSPIMMQPAGQVKLLGLDVVHALALWFHCFLIHSGRPIGLNGAADGYPVQKCTPNSSSRSMAGTSRHSQGGSWTALARLQWQRRKLGTKILRGGFGMKAAIFDSRLSTPGGWVSIEDLPRPQPQPGEVLIKVLA